jgi:hypothetical protein
MGYHHIPIVMNDIHHIGLDVPLRKATIGILDITRIRLEALISKGFADDLGTLASYKDSHVIEDAKTRANKQRLQRLAIPQRLASAL